MNSGALHRYLAEAVWYPTALLPSDQLHWTPVNDSLATASLTDGGTTVSLEFRFNEDGEVTGIFTPERWGSFEGGFRQAAWEGHFPAYQSVHGMRVPSEGEVGWYSPDGEWQPVWRSVVTDIDFHLCP